MQTLVQAIGEILMNNMDKETTDYRDTSDHNKKNQRVWMYVLLGVLLFAGIFTWQSLSSGKGAKTPANSLSSSSATGTMDQQEIDTDRGSNSASPNFESR